MITDESRKLRARIADALDHTTWERRIDAIETLIEERTAVVEDVAYRQGRAFGEQNERDALDRANALIRRLSREAMTVEAAADRVRDVLDELDRETGAYEASYKGWALQVIRQVRAALDGEQ